MKRVCASVMAVTMLFGWVDRASAQEQPASPAPPTDDYAKTSKKLAEVGKNLNQLKKRVDAHDTGIRTLTDGLGTAQGILTTHDELIRNHSSDLAALRKQLDDLEKKLDQIAKFDESKEYISLKPAVVTSTQGRIVLDNDTRIDQYLYVNGVRWRLLPGKSYVNVPHGLVTVQRPGEIEERLSFWKRDKEGYFVEYSLAHGPTVGHVYPQ